MTKSIKTITVMAFVGIAFSAGPVTKTVDFQRLVPGYGPNSLKQFLGLTPKGETLNFQFQRDYDGLTFTSYGVATFAGRQDYYLSAHEGVDFPGDPGGSTVFIHNTTTPANTPPGGVLVLVWNDALLTVPAANRKHIRNVTIKVADGNPTVGTPRIRAEAFNPGGFFIGVQYLMNPTGILEFPSLDTGAVELFDTGADGHIVLELKYTVQ